MSIYRRFLLAVTVAALLMACDDSPTAPDGGPISFETVVATSSSGFETPERDVIRNDDQWARVWDLLHARSGSVPARPEVDFGRQMLVLAAMGTQSNGCYQIEVTAIDLRQGRLAVEVVERQPGATCVCTQALTQPVHVVALDRVGLDAGFDVTGQPLSC